VTHTIFATVEDILIPFAVFATCLIGSYCGVVDLAYLVA